MNENPFIVGVWQSSHEQSITERDGRIDRVKKIGIDADGQWWTWIEETRVIYAPPSLFAFLFRFRLNQEVLHKLPIDTYTAIDKPAGL
jgi:hypothetical protein